MDPELLLAHAPFVRSLARALLRDENDVDDVVQQTWLAALRHPPRDPSASGAARGWLARVVRSIVRETRRGAIRRDQREQQAARPELETESDPAHAVARLQLLRELVDAVLALAEPYRSVVLQRYLDELPPAEIARREQTPVATIDTRLRRAREQLRQRLDARHGPGGNDDERRAALLAGLAGLATGAAVMGVPLKLAIAAGVLGIAAWIAWPAFAPDGASRQVAANAIEAKAEPARSDADRERASEATTAMDATSRTPDAAADSAVPTSAGVSLLVVAKESGEPLAGASVSLQRFAADPRDRTRERFRWGMTSRRAPFLEDDEDLDSRRELALEIEKTGRSFTTDGNGLVVLPPFEAGTVVARHGERALATWLDARAPPPIRLELGSDVAMRIRVVDERGSPVADVPVKIETQIQDLGVAVWWRGRTRASGIAEVWPFVFDMARRSGRRELFAALGMPATPAVRVKLDPNHLLAEPIELTLLPTGSLHIELRDGAGRLLTEPAFVGIGVKKEWGHYVPGDKDLIWRPAHDGVVDFEKLGLGLELTAYLHVVSQERQPRVVDCRGPSAANEVAHAVLVAGDPIPVLTGRLLGPDGEPIAVWGVRATFEITTTQNYSGAVTDEEGAFRLPLALYAWQYTDEWKRFAKNILRLTLEEPAALGPEYVAAAIVMPLTAEQLEPGVHDLGDLHFEGATIVAAGVVVDGRGVPQNHLQLVVERRSNSDVRWYADLNYLETSGADGSFTIRGRIDDAKVRCNVRAPGLFVSQPAEFDAGSKNVRVVVERAAELRGRIVVDPGIPVDELTFKLSESFVILGSFEIAPSERIQRGRDGAFTIDTVRPGSGSLTLGIASSGAARDEFEPLLTIDDIETKSGAAASDERLAAIDLRGKLRQLELRVVDDAGAPCADVMVTIDAEPVRDRPCRRHATTDARGVARLLAAAPTYQVQVEADGFEPTTLAGVPSSREIVLRRAR